MFKVNDKVKFEVRTKRQGEGFSLSWSGQVTMEEDMTRKELSNALADEFLQDVNKPRTDNPYTSNELVITLKVA